MSDHEDIIAAVLAEVAPPAGLVSDRAYTSAEIATRRERVIQVASELHDGLNGKPFQWRGGDAQYGMPMTRAMGLTLVTKKGAKISIAGGSLENGAPTVTLTKNKALTLMNTADGTRYVLRLVSVS